VGKPTTEDSQRLRRPCRISHGRCGISPQRFIKTFREKSKQKVVKSTNFWLIIRPPAQFFVRFFQHRVNKPLFKINSVRFLLYLIATYSSFYHVFYRQVFTKILCSSHWLQYITYIQYIQGIHSTLIIATTCMHVHVGKPQCSIPFHYWHCTVSMVSVVVYMKPCICSEQFTDLRYLKIVLRMPLGS
jgi:hypothetical protein